jgi:hypothetical protein
MLVTKLPIEIFDDIGCYLTSKDVAACQKVCKAWYKRWIIFTYYSTQTRGKLQFHQFFEQTLKQSIYPPGTEFSVGHQIRKLVIENGLIEPSVLGQLPLLCPYLEVFMFDGVILSEEARREPFQYYQQRKHKEELNSIRHNFGHWKNMRQIVEFNGITVAQSLLNNIQLDQVGGYTKLTHISVQFNNSNDRTNSKASFIESLANAPLLESLSIERVYLSVMELEKIHDSCPRLYSLYLINTVLLPMIEEFHTQDITPATNLLDLQLVDSSFCDDVPRWLDYISIKYVNVKNLDIGSYSFASEEDNISKSSSMTNTFHHSYQKQLFQIAKRLTKLETLKLLSFSLGTAFFDILDQRGTFLSKLTLGDGLSTLLLANELSTLMQSHQRQHITSLTINGWPLSTAIQGTILIMETLNQCSNLTSLQLSMGRYLHQNKNTALANNPASNNMVDNGTLYFDFILEQCPKLISLTINDAKLITTTNVNNRGMASIFTPLVSPNAFLYPLQSLVLDNVLFETDSIFDIIGSKCPALNHLSLTSTVPNPEHLNARQLKIHLPRHQLKTLVLDRIRISRKCSIRLGTSRFKITSALKTTWYDLVGYECCMSHFSVSPPITTNNGNNNRRISSKYLQQCSSISSDMTMMLSEKMRARKVKVTHGTNHGLDYNLDQSVYVAVVCKDVESIYLTGLQV